MRLDGKVAIITGAAGGIGQATAGLFRKEGATVVAVDINPLPSEEVLELDVGDLDQWTALVSRVVDEHGTIDILVNNAGVVGAYEGIVDISLDDWRSVLRVNLDGVFYGMRSVIPVMQAAQRGSIVNFSSIWGIAGASGVAAYQAAKGATRTLSKNAALTYVGDGIRVNSLHPGLVMTPMIAAQDPAITQVVLEATPMKRGADPIELAYGALFLSSDESSFMTGAELVIDGGYLAA
jgi:NAD(P)-dependent dehydrogenase (short-subunit alcohol dehydrogenase family)